MPTPSSSNLIRRRRNRRLGATAVVALTAIIAGGGGSTRTSEPTSCLAVYFVSGATRRQEDAVRSMLERDKRVRSIRFVSKQEALSALGKKYPDLTKQLSSNPFPDSLVVTVARHEAAGLRASLEPLKPPLENATASDRACVTGQ